MRELVDRDVGTDSLEKQELMPSNVSTLRKLSTGDDSQEAWPIAKGWHMKLVVITSVKLN